MTHKKNFLIVCFAFCGLLACTPATQKKYVFEVLDHATTGLHFANTLASTPTFNMFKYMYFYNGAGIAAADFNKDGKVDLFFCSNQGNNQLYINKGSLSFADVTNSTHIPQDGGWSTGASVVDINNDGLLDIYVCRVGNYENLQSRNQLLICTGISKEGMPQYKNLAKEYGLDFSGFSTQAAFFDYDVDGDVDMFLLNHSLRFNGTFAERNTYTNTYDSLAGDKLYKNENGKFVDVTRTTGINASVIGYGLGICVSDINLDGYPDIYIGNDFHENDYLYINQKNGTFKDELTTSMRHTSQFSMGVDVADINNDACPDIISVDMLPEDPYILKRSLGEDEYNLFNYKTRAGYFPQYARNNLQLNNGDGTFSEIGRYAGIEATDWSWAPLWLDIDNDGLKDLFVSNGIPKRLNDMDYVAFVSNDELQTKIRRNEISNEDLTLINKFPEIKLKNKFFMNNGNAAFTDIADQIKNDLPTYSNGSVYADFDNDGDQDVVVNNINDPALLYKNTTNDHQAKNAVQVTLKGPSSNINAIGTKIIVFDSSGIRLYEKFTVKGFQSSMEIPLNLGTNKIKIDSAFLIWPDNTYQKIKWDTSTTQIAFTYQPHLSAFDYAMMAKQKKFLSVENITQSTQLTYQQVENPFIEFDREPLIPHMVSREGPALAVADVNADGLEDIFIGSSKGNKSAVFLQKSNGQFTKTIQPYIDNDSTYEDVNAVWIDVNNDTYIDLVVASGGNEYYGHSEYVLPRVYLNNGKAQWVKRIDAFDSIYTTISCVAATDFNGDGYPDLFLGGRAIPWEYGQTPTSYLLQNDRTGKFKNVTDGYNKELATIGMVTCAQWVDVNNDKKPDLILSLEWGGIVAFIADKGKLTQQTLSAKKGWWNFVLPADVDGDGDIDFIAGNLGLNNRLHATAETPVKLYYNDFDGNGKKEQLLTYFLKGKEIPFANKDELQKQIPLLKKKFLYAENFAKASLAELFTRGKLDSSTLLEANYFNNTVLLNNGAQGFSEIPLPWQAQLTTYKDAVMVNANDDALPDVLLVGNFFNNNIQMGSYDAAAATILINKGKGQFAVEQSIAPAIIGQVRHVKKMLINKQEAWLLAKNNDSLAVLKRVKSLY
jgi:enediyne biosynthesis protein E4